MKCTLYRMLALAGLAATLPAIGANITFYQDDYFRGRSDAFFRGRCTTLSPGDYPTWPR
jgi:hypothetical protein